MTTSHPATVRQPRQRALAIFAGLIAVSAWFGALGLMVGWIGLGESLDSRLPLDSPVLGAVALATVVAVPLGLLALYAWIGDPRTGAAAVRGGVLLLGWIAVQLAILRHFSFFQPLCSILGVIILVAGLRSKGSGREPAP